MSGSTQHGQHGSMETHGHAKSARKRLPPAKWGMFALFGLGLAGIAGWQWVRLAGSERTDNAQIEGTVVPVQARVSGFALRVPVRDDEAVKAGDTLYMLDPTEYLLKVRQAEADLWAARAAAKGGVAGAGAQAAQAQKAVAESNVEAARANLEKADRELQRTTLLHDRDVASQSQLDAAQAARQAAEAQLRAATEQVHATGYGEVGAAAQVRLAEARIAAAQAALDYARAQLGWTVAVAPFAGHVARRSVEPGQFLSAGQPVMSVVADSGLWVVANLKETQIARVEAGAAVDIEVDAFPGVPLRGKVRSIQPATGSRFSLLPPDNASGNFTKVVQRVPVRIDIEPSPEVARLRPGMSVSVRIDAGN